MRKSADDLTPSQREAVEHFEGPLLILAGPGSGKTRVMTRRIARLIERRVSPREILAITFTNKAAREMAERVEKLLPGQRIWVSTFHRFCARVLREHGRSLGLNQNFTIYDTSDQQQIIKQVLHDEDIDSTHFPAAKIGHRISQAKNELITAEQYQSRYRESIGTHMDAVVGRVYPRYQEKLLEANAVDFDDLLVHVALLLQDQPELCAELDYRHRFILVDEYQDTNRAQYQIVAALSRREPNLCACGDPDQSIYGWRGARIENILRFEQDFPNVKLIRLEDNFRSTPEILRTADALIAHNIHRKAKVLRTGKASGDAVELRLYDDGQAEATAIAAEIRELVASGANDWSDFAILYRVNALSRSLETALTRQKVPYQIAGGVAFFDRAEIKDLLGYLRLIENPADRVAFRRVVNTPTRGIGKNTQEKLLRFADAQGLTPVEAARNPQQIPGLPKRAIPALQMFSSLLDEFTRLATGPIADLLNRVVDRTHFTATWLNDSGEEEMQRLANVQELIAAARQYDDAPDENHSLSGFLESASLASDVDNVNSAAGTVTLMTLHSAKGLEFPCVYLVAVEQNILPHERSLRENDFRQLEEERRLLFVGITRAEERLVLTHTLRRETHGRSLSTIPSDFLREMGLESSDCTGVANSPFPSLAYAPFVSPAKTTDPARVAASPAESASTVKPSSVVAGLKSQLMTGAELLSKQTATGSNVAPAVSFSIGMSVRHPRYGTGEVTGLEGESRWGTVTVRFRDPPREETFIAAKCPLQPLGLR